MGELQERIEHSEFLEWIAFYETEPWGESRLEIHSAMLAAVIANVNRGKKGKKVKVSDLMVDWWHDSAKPEAIMAKLRAVGHRMEASSQRATIAKPKPAKDNGTRPRNTRSRSGS